MNAQWVMAFIIQLFLVAVCAYAEIEQALHGDWMVWLACLGVIVGLFRARRCWRMLKFCQSKLPPLMDRLVSNYNLMQAMDMTYIMTLTEEGARRFGEIYEYRKRLLSVLRRVRTCPECRGKGLVDEWRGGAYYGMEDCHICGGTGRI